MLTCIACTKQLNTNNGGSTQHEDEEDGVLGTPRTKQAIKSLTSQLKDMAVKASGAYKNCKPCSGTSNRNQNRNYAGSDAASDSGRFHYAYQRAGTASSTPKIWGKETESRLKGLSSEEGTPTSMSGRTESIVFMEEDEAKEWVAQVEPGVLITFVSLPQGGNDLKRIRFSREMFNKWQAQRWWAENFEKVMELYNVQQFNQQSVPLPTPPVSEDGGSQIQSAKDSPVTPPLDTERPRSNIPGSSGFASTPKLSSISGTKTETSSIEGSARSSSVDRSEEVSVSNASDMENEWVEQDEPGIYITIRALPDGNRELRRVRFSRDKFGETHARLWWEQNRARIQQQYFLLLITTLLDNHLVGSRRLFSYLSSFNSPPVQSSHMQFQGVFHSTQPGPMANPHHMGLGPGGNAGLGVAHSPSPVQVGAYQQPQLGHLNWPANF